MSYDDDQEDLNDMGVEIVRLEREVEDLKSKHGIDWKQRARDMQDVAKRHRNRAKRLERERDKFRELLELPLLFHKGSPFLPLDKYRWLRITGGNECTTKVMCDTIRAGLAG